MNKIKFLGTAGARFVVTRQLRKSGGLWLTFDDTNILIDPGPGSLVRCLSSRPKLNPKDLDGIILTHRHIDHSNDINIMIEAMTNGGKLSISAYPEARQIIIEVGDTGRGIPPEDLPQVFDPFFTSNPQGSGLGLTTVHRIVSEHNGEISVKSTIGEGTEFRIRLPLYPDDIHLSELEGPRRKS